MKEVQQKNVDTAERADHTTVLGGVKNSLRKSAGALFILASTFAAPAQAQMPEGDPKMPPTPGKKAEENPERVKVKQLLEELGKFKREGATVEHALQAADKINELIPLVEDDNLTFTELKKATDLAILTLYYSTHNLKHYEDNGGTPFYEANLLLERKLAENFREKMRKKGPDAANSAMERRRLLGDLLWLQFYAGGDRIHDLGGTHIKEEWLDQADACEYAAVIRELPKNHPVALKALSKSLPTMANRFKLPKNYKTPAGGTVRPDARDRAAHLQGLQDMRDALPRGDKGPIVNQNGFTREEVHLYDKGLELLDREHFEQVNALVKSDMPPQCRRILARAIARGMSEDEIDTIVSMMQKWSFDPLDARLARPPVRDDGREPYRGLGRYATLLVDLHRAHEGDDVLHRYTGFDREKATNPDVQRRFARNGEMITLLAIDEIAAALPTGLQSHPIQGSLWKMWLARQKQLVEDGARNSRDIPHLGQWGETVGVMLAMKSGKPSDWDDTKFWNAKATHARNLVTADGHQASGIFHQHADRLWQRFRNERHPKKQDVEATPNFKDELARQRLLFLQQVTAANPKASKGSLRAFFDSIGFSKDEIAQVCGEEMKNK